MFPKQNKLSTNDDPILDWKLTAFALGELDAEDTNRVEQHIKNDAALQRELAEIRETLGILQTVLTENGNAMALDAKRSERISHGISEATQMPSESLSCSTVNNQVASADSRYLLRRKKFAALLATAALVPIAFFAASRWMISDSQIAESQALKPTNSMSTESETVLSATLDASDASTGRDANRQSELTDMGAAKESVNSDGIREELAAATDYLKESKSRDQNVELKSDAVMIAEGLAQKAPSVPLDLSSGLNDDVLSKRGRFDEKKVVESEVRQKGKIQASEISVPQSTAMAEDKTRSDELERKAEPKMNFSLGSQPANGETLEKHEVGQRTVPSSKSEAEDGNGPGKDYDGYQYLKRSGDKIDGIAGPAQPSPAGVNRPISPSPNSIGGGRGGYGVEPGHPFGGGGGLGGGGLPGASSEALRAGAESGGAYGAGYGGSVTTPAPEGDYVQPPTSKNSNGYGNVVNESKLAGMDGQRASESRLPEELRSNAPNAFRLIERSRENLSGDRFESIVENPFIGAQQNPLSTFSIDVDTASYSKIRQYLMQTNAVPQPKMVRIEEMINYFEYAYEGPKDDSPFAAHMAIERCPWNPTNRLVRIGLQARKMNMQQRASANIVFLLDVSGSMNEPNKLPLVKKALSMLTNQLGENDKVAIVVYAGAAGCVLPSTNGANKQAILSALEHLHAGGSTNGGQGIQLAYSIARENFISGGINRVILCTDGDFNVGVTGDDALVEMMQANAKSNVFLTCLGFGMGNYNDTMMEKISNKGNGIYGMIDNEMEARRMMVEQMAGTLVTIAKDVKIQVDFNPKRVASYRLIGYEDRKLANRDFDDDRKDAGEIGAGHRVTALYEIVSVGQNAIPVPNPDSEVSKYQLPSKPSPTPAAIDEDNPLDQELLTLKVRYKQPEAQESTKQEFVLNANQERTGVDLDLQWVSAVAEFGLLLRNSQYAPNASWSSMLERASEATQGDPYRLECIQMMRRAAQLQRR